MIFDESDHSELENALSALSEPEYGWLLSEIRETVADNLCRGRARKFLQTGHCRSLAEYVQLVARTIKSEAQESRRLPAGDGQDDWWRLLQQKLRAQAYFLLLRLGVDHYEAYQRADDFAQDACLKIFVAKYPADVPFTAWAQRILRNTILSKLRRRPDTLDVPGAITALEEDEEAGATTAPETDPIEEAENRGMFQQALCQLPSETQRKVILLELNGFTAQEIALTLDRSAQAVYNLRHRAILEMKATVAA